MGAGRVGGKGKIMDVGRYEQKMGVGLGTDEKLAPTSMRARVTERIPGWQCCRGDGVSDGSLMKGWGTDPYRPLCLASETSPWVTSWCQSGPLLLLLSAFLVFLGGLQLDWVWGGGQSLRLGPGSG